MVHNALHGLLHCLAAAGPLRACARLPLRNCGEASLRTPLRWFRWSGTKRSGSRRSRSAQAPVLRARPAAQAPVLSARPAGAGACQAGASACARAGSGARAGAAGRIGGHVCPAAPSPLALARHCPTAWQAPLLRWRFLAVPAQLAPQPLSDPRAQCQRRAAVVTLVRPSRSARLARASMKSVKEESLEGQGRSSLHLKIS